MKFYNFSAGKGRVGDELHSKTQRLFFFLKVVWILHPHPLRFQPSPHHVAQKDGQHVFRVQPSSAACLDIAPESVKDRAGGIRH